MSMSQSVVEQIRDNAQRAIDAGEGHHLIVPRTAWDVRNLCDEILELRRLSGLEH